MPKIRKNGKFLYNSKYTGNIDTYIQLVNQYIILPILATHSNMTVGQLVQIQKIYSILQGISICSRIGQSIILPLLYIYFFREGRLTSENREYIGTVYYREHRYFRVQASPLYYLYYVYIVRQGRLTNGNIQYRGIVYYREYRCQ